MVAGIATAALLLVGLVAPAGSATAADNTGSSSLSSIGLKVSYSMDDVVTGNRPRVARASFTFDHPRSTLSLRGLRSSSAYIVGPGSRSAQRVHLVKDSEHRAHADFLLDASDPAGTYYLAIEINTTVDGQAYTIFKDRGLKFSVKRATTATASSKRSGSKTVVSGSVTRSQAVDYQTAVATRPFARVKVKLYFDPQGAQGARYKATVTTGSDGRYRKTLTYPGKGRWIAKYAGSSQYAPSGVRTAGAREPAVKRTYITSDTALGTKVTMKVVSQNVVAGSRGKKMRVDVSFATSGPGSLVTSDLHTVCATSRIGHYDWYCSDLVRDSATRLHADFWFGPSDPASVYDLEVWGDLWVRASGERDSVEPRMAQTGSFRVTKSTRTTVRLSDASVRKGATVKVKGTLAKPSATDANNGQGWRPTRGQSVKIYFDPKGSAKAAYRGTVRVSSKGTFSKNFRVTRSGTWIVKYPGSDAVHLRASSAKVSMSVR